MNSFRIGFTAAIALLLLAGNVYASDWYVSSINGNDTTGDGISAKSSFRSIAKAIKAADGQDAIYIDGAGGKAKYFEKVVVPEGKNGLSLIGQNSAELNGKIFNQSNENNNAIEINSDFVTVKSLIIREYNQGKNATLPSQGAAAVYCRDRTMTVLENLTIEDCTYGIVLWASQNSDVSNCKIERMHKAAQTEIGGGIGILVWSNGEYLQANEIGVNKPNTISKCEGYGILVGGRDTSVFVDQSIINNNHLVANSVGLGLLASTGIMRIEKNFFDDNAIGVKMLGAALDTYIAGNTFQNSKAGIAIEAESKIDGALLADIWLKNENAFPRTSCAVMSKKEIADTKGKRYIFSNPDAAAQLIQDKKQLVNFVDMKK